MQTDQSLILNSSSNQVSPVNPYKYKKSNNSCISSTASTASLSYPRSSPSEDISLNSSVTVQPYSSRPTVQKKDPRLLPILQRMRRQPAPTQFKTPTRALLDYFDRLTIYEREEISLYDEVYTVGGGCEKNVGDFDDENGYYKAIEGDHLAYRYEIKEFLGCGTFGHVFKCFDFKRNLNVAVKIIRNKTVYRKAGDLENKILHELANADPNDLNCIVKKLRSFEFRNHLCLVFELLSLNLYQFLHKNEFKGLSLALIRRISVQLFMALKTFHSVGIIHCDLKPDNILLKFENKSSIKVIDFGSACQSGNKVYDYIQSRYYRAPEVLFETGYDKAIDIWSVGCILFELITGTPLFPANNENELFKLTVETLGLPPDDFFSKGMRSHHYMDIHGRARRQVFPSTRPLNVLLSNFDDKLINLIESCVRWRPEDRIEADQGLSHAWVRGSRSSLC